MSEVLELEKQKLAEVLVKFQENIEELKFRIEFLPSTYRDNLDLFAAFSVLYSRKLELMEKTAQKPYFARIDFRGDGSDLAEICYIGKVGVFDTDDTLVTVDWRAPIAALYYDSNLGAATYRAPDGEICGQMLTKRQYDIESGILNSYQDVDTVSNDEILKPYLGVNAENRLKNIVASIQQEQNLIIRERFGQNLIVQGVAGSGKTTVALHRVAFLVYNHIDKIKPEQYLVIGPNTFFISYISGVLPDLDVNNVVQSTFENLAKTFVDENFQVNPVEKNLLMAMSGEDMTWHRHKTTMDYKAEIDAFLENFYTNLIPSEDFVISFGTKSSLGTVLIKHATIKKIYQELDRNIYKDVATRIEKACLLLSNQLENTYGQGFLKELRKHFSKANVKATTLYNEFLGQPKLKKYDFEDLAALMYIKYKLTGKGDLGELKHVVIDEAQDLGKFHFYVIRQILQDASFSIFGDLAQSIYGHRGIENWKGVAEDVFAGHCQVMELVKSYRTTIEIMQVANRINRHLGLNEAEAVIRHGKDVSFTEFFNDQDQIELVIDKIAGFKEAGHKTIAVICKEPKGAEQMEKNLRAKGLEIKSITSSDHEYEGGMCVITSHLAKGLEFDAVIVADASSIQYVPGNVLDMKLLYVALTRALHELEVLYEEELTGAFGC